MNIIVTGANGQLGNSMRIAAMQSPHKFIFTDVCEASNDSVSMLHKLGAVDADITTITLDITDIEAVRRIISDYKIQIVVNCAAWTNVDAAESNSGIAERLNADAPANLALAIKEAGGLLVQISTDYIFGREPYNKPCREEQQGTPTGVYGLTKLHGERRIIASGCDYVIIRTAWLYSEFGKNFCKTMLSLTATKPELNVVFDQAGTPTYASDLAVAILRIIDDYSLKGKEHCGIYHYSNEGVCSWFDFTKMIQEYSGQTTCCVKPCHSSEFPSPVVRPAYSVLDKTKIKQVFGIDIPYWIDSLRKCINNLQKA